MIGRLLLVIAYGVSCLAAGYAVRVDHWPMPRLIGHGCEMAGGDIWAMDESDFPTMCREIERYG